MFSFSYAGKAYTYADRVTLLVEKANGSASYTLSKGFSNAPDAIRHFDWLAVGRGQKKRLTMISGGKRTVIARVSG